ncbi:MAG: NgoMIV family type II restriction endonuclease [Anaerolineales bacterium]
MLLDQLRQEYHQRICREIVRVQAGSPPYPNFADKTNKASREIAWNILQQIGYQAVQGNQLPGQTAGGRFEEITRDFLEKAFERLNHLRPGKWLYQTGTDISQFDQYEHLARLQKLTQSSGDLASVLGSEYIITPDVIVARAPVEDDEINRSAALVTGNSLANLTPLRAINSRRFILHASISCKWTLRSDRSQNARSEALNLIRQRKGNTPHIVVVVAEPLPTRIASLALGTGDIDCVYHFALPDLQKAIIGINNEDQFDLLKTLIEGRRLRDISDLPFDLAL